jgi:predicted dehydrogenase
MFLSELRLAGMVFGSVSSIKEELMRVAIIGSGLQCGRRAPVILSNRNDTVAVICGIEAGSTTEMARRFGSQSATDWRSVVTRDDIDAVLICTPPHIHADISIAAMRHGKHVFCEKPLCRTVEEAEAIIQVVRESGRVFKCAFNHRFHPAVREAKRLADQGDLGRLLFSRCRYGYVGRQTYAKEWRADPTQVIGGPLVEQGIHGIDLFRWFLGDIAEVVCMTSQQYFTDQPFEDNAMALFKSVGGSTASLHSSLTQWKNMFSFEIFGEDGYATVEGLGASYGTEQLTVGKRHFTAPFAHTTTEYRAGDSSWAAEWADFSQAVCDGRPLSCGDVYDGYQALRVTLACYESSRTNRFVDPRGILQAPGST